MTAIENKVQEIVEPIINSIGYQIYDIIYEKEGKDNYLRIFLDGDNITIQDCEKVNNEITDVLDEKDVIKSQYFLEISSPGLERRIRSDKHLEKAKNSKVEIHLFKPINKEKILVGILQDFDENKIYVKIEDEKKTKNLNTEKTDKTKNIENSELEIEKSNISKMNIVYNWEEN